MPWYLSYFTLHDNGKNIKILYPTRGLDEMKLVGFVFDKKMSLEPMVKRSSKKGRAKIAALYRLKPYLDSQNAQNIETMYKAFVRS